MGGGGGDDDGTGGVPPSSSLEVSFIQCSLFLPYYLPPACIIIRRSTPSLPDDVLRRHFEHVFISVQFTSPSHKEPLASKVFPLSDPDVVKALMVRQEEEEENRLALEVSPPIAPIDLGGCTMEVMMIDGAEGKALGHGTTKCHGIDDGFWDCYVPVDGGGRRVDGSLTMEARPRWEPSTIDEDMVPSTMAVDIYMRFQLGDECEKLDFFDSVREGWLTMAQVFMPWKKVKMA